MNYVTTTYGFTQINAISLYDIKIEDIKFNK